MKARLALSAALLASGCLAPVKPAGGDTVRALEDRGALASAVIAEWSRDAALAARHEMEVYGTPDEVRRGRLIWRERKPFKRVAAVDARPDFIEGDELGLLELTVPYPLTDA